MINVMATGWGPTLLAGELSGKQPSEKVERMVEQT
jgi:hypothetical protein